MSDYPAKSFRALRLGFDAFCAVDHGESWECGNPFKRYMWCARVTRRMVDMPTL
jgi:hypothetical protein